MKCTGRQCLSSSSASCRRSAIFWSPPVSSRSSNFSKNSPFSDEEIDWLAQAEHFRPDFLHWLKSVRFTGDVNAMPEGTVFFPNEPILQIIAPLPEAQLVETRLINLLNFQTAVASKAARSSFGGAG